MSNTQLRRIRGSFNTKYTAAGSSINYFINVTDKNNSTILATCITHLNGANHHCLNKFQASSLPTNIAKVKVKYPRYRPTCPRGVQEVRAPRFLDTRHMKVVRSSPLRTGRLYPQEYPDTDF